MTFHDSFGWLLLAIFLILLAPHVADAEVAPIEHEWRVHVACVEGAWRPEYQVGRKSPSKGVFECTHAIKNVVTEWARRTGLWNRGGRDPSTPEGYHWDLYYRDRLERELWERFLLL